MKSLDHLIDELKAKGHDPQAGRFVFHPDHFRMAGEALVRGYKATVDRAQPAGEVAFLPMITDKHIKVG